MSAPPSKEYLATLQHYRDRYMDTPIHVHIETIGACNGKCTFCPHGIMDRRGKRMSDELFEKIVQDLKQIPLEAPFAISPFKVNEPLLDPKIFSRLDRLATELPHATFLFTSNFNLATERMLKQLSQVKRLEYIWISLNSLREDDYRDLMGLSLPRTVENINKLLQLNRELSFTPQIVLARVLDATAKDDQFLNDAQAIFADFEYGSDYEIVGTQRGQWMGFTDSPAKPKPQWPCIRWFELSITCTGEVAFCCMDGLCKQPLGDVNKQSVLEIYNQPWYLELRQKQPQRSKVKGGCQGCTFS